jgi:hypothetical protein
VPKYGSREIVVLFAGLATCDPTDIKTTIAKLKVPARHDTHRTHDTHVCSP